MKNPKKERSFVIVKPDGVQRALMGEIVSRIEKTGLKVVAMKFFVPDEDRLWKHYNKDDKWFQEKGQKIFDQKKEMGLPTNKEPIEYGKDIIKQLVEFMSCGPVLALVIEGNEAVGIVKKLVGGTEPLTSDVGTIRGDLTLDSYSLAGIDERAVRNLIHCSDEVSEAQREIKLWFEENELVKYKSIQERMLYDVNLDGILE